MSQPTGVSMKAFISVIIVDIIFGIIILLAASQFDPSLIDTDNLILTFVTEILLVEVESIFFPAISVWNERRLIVKGTSAVLSRGEKLKNEAKRLIYGVWCYQGWLYSELANYFRKEKELINKGIEIHRLVNVELAGEEHVKRHCEEFRDEIINKKYILTAVKYHSREVLIIDRKKALILYQDLFSKEVGGGIGPYAEPNWVASYTHEYEELERENADYRLVIDPSNPQKSIEDWIKTSLGK